jgi:Apea-like HEPN
MNEININCQDEIKEEFTSLSLKIKQILDSIKLSLTPIKIPEFIPYYSNEDEDKNLGLIHPSRIVREEKDYYIFSDLIYESVKDTEEYRSIIRGANFNDLSSLLNEDRIKQFIFNVGGKLINTSDSNENIINDTIEIFINDLCDRPIKAKTIINLSGIDVFKSQVSLPSECSKIILRSVEKSDVVRKINSKHINIFGLDMDRFSSVVEIEHNDDINIEVNKMVALLRLYAVASVNYKYYETKEETVIQRGEHPGVTKFQINSIEINPRVKSQEFSVLVTDKNYSKLVAHYQSLYKSIPPCIYDDKSVKTSINVHHPNLEVAYRHYSDALVRKIDEKEIILNAVIGLESLLVEGSGDNNLRFWLRGTKILSFFNDSALAIKDILLSAYNTRSKFVHGDSDSLDSALKKFDKTNKNQDRFVSLKNLLECLRVLTILNVFLITKDEFVKKTRKNHEFDREKFFKLVDNSLIDNKAVEKLSNILEECRQTFDINLKLISLNEYE